MPQNRLHATAVIVGFAFYPLAITLLLLGLSEPAHQILTVCLLLAVVGLLSVGYLIGGNRRLPPEASAALTVFIGLWFGFRLGALFLSLALLVLLAVRHELRKRNTIGPGDRINRLHAIALVGFVGQMFLLDCALWYELHQSWLRPWASWFTPEHAMAAALVLGLTTGVLLIAGYVWSVVMHRGGGIRSPLIVGFMLLLLAFAGGGGSACLLHLGVIVVFLIIVLLAALR